MEVPDTVFLSPIFAPHQVYFVYVQMLCNISVFLQFIKMESGDGKIKCFLLL